jgi:hypothetical protein
LSLASIQAPASIRALAFIRDLAFIQAQPEPGLYSSPAFIQAQLLFEPGFFSNNYGILIE